METDEIRGKKVYLILPATYRSPAMDIVTAMIDRCDIMVDLHLLGDEQLRNEIAGLRLRGNVLLNDPSS